MKTALEAVQQFHFRNHQLVSTKPCILPTEVLILRQRLIQEELGETLIALHENKREEFADGLCDLLYVVLGTAVSSGHLVEDWFQTGFIQRKALEPESLMKSTISTGLIWSAARVCTVQANFLNDDYQSAYEACFKEIVFAAVQFGFDFQACFFEVHRANMSKRARGSGDPNDGKKYGIEDPKGAGFVPANLKPFLGL